MPRLDYGQHRKMRKLVRKCCNYDYGNCIALDDGETHVCMQSISYSLLCKWFRAAVLTLDSALYAAAIEKDSGKRCAERGVLFMATSDRGKFCPSCSQRIRSRKEAERQRKSYYRSTHLVG